MKKKIFFLFLFLLLCFWGAGRAYYALTDGFSPSNLEPAYCYRPSEDLPTLSDEAKELVERLLSSEFVYLGKGCQSYVFASEKEPYVLKLVKHHRFRTKPWLDMAAFLPVFDRYKRQRQAHKEKKMRVLLDGWATAYSHLSEETGVVWSYLGQESPLALKAVIKDKNGRRFEIDLQKTQFLLQRRVEEMLCPHLRDLLQENRLEEGKAVIDRLLAMIVGEYARGFADYDHAVMQNTGIANGMPVHIDVGQLTYEEAAKEDVLWKQHLYNKTYRLRHWLKEQSVDLYDHLELRCRQLIGEGYSEMKADKEVVSLYPWLNAEQVDKRPHSMGYLFAGVKSAKGIIRNGDGQGLKGGLFIVEGDHIG